MSDDNEAAAALKYMKERDAARTEVFRLRATLERIVYNFETDEGATHKNHLLANLLAGIARDALEVKP